MTTPYTLEQYVEDLRRITAGAGDEGEILAQVQPLAKRLAEEKSWVQERHYEADPEQGFGVHILHEEPDHTLAVFALSWLPGRGAPLHDHGTWAVVAGVDGDERNILYARVDDRSREDYAELEVKQDFTIADGDVISMRSGGIHEVLNESDRVTLSLHTYGKHLNHTGRSQFDRETNTRKDFIISVD
jgi:predicted metal-dependent enzyme (double-stranded beta helix superfamily)